MALIPKYRIELFKKTGEKSWSTTPVILDDFVNIDIRAGIETTKDVFKLSARNYRGTTSPVGSYSNQIGLRSVPTDNLVRVDDELQIFGYYGNTLPVNREDALLMVGAVTKFSHTSAKGANTIAIDGVNRTEELLNVMIPFATRAQVGTTNTCPSAVVQMIRRLNTWNARKNVFAYLSTESNPYTGSFGLVQATQSDHTDSYTDGLSAWASNGTAFPTIDYNESWKPTYYNIEKLSGPEYTKDTLSQYIFYMKYSKTLPQYQKQYGSFINELVWKSKSLTTAGSLFEHSNFNNVTTSLDTKDIINLYIVNAGTDVSGNGIVGVSYNLDSIGKYGAKMAYYSKSRRLYSEVYKSEINLAVAAGSTIESDGLPATADFPMLMSFTGRNSDLSRDITDLLTATSKKTYNQYLREETRAMGMIEGNEVLKRLGDPIFSVKADLIIGSNDIVPGNIYEFVIPSYGWEGTAANPGYRLRVMDMQHKFDKSGWTTTIVAEEDEKVISEQLGNK